MRPHRSVRVPVLLGLAALVSGCGNGGPVSEGGSRGVIASAADCVSFGPDLVDDCATAIERAVASHESSTTSYSNVEACEKAVGANKCERAESGRYRARLSAFMVTVSSNSARAEPLYPGKDGTVGFLTSSKNPVLASDQSVAFSRLALSVAEMQAGSGSKSGRNKKL